MPQQDTQTYEVEVGGKVYEVDVPRGTPVEKAHRMAMNFVKGQTAPKPVAPKPVVSDLDSLALPAPDRGGVAGGSIFPDRIAPHPAATTTRKELKGAPTYKEDKVGIPASRPMKGTSLVRKPVTGYNPNKGGEERRARKIQERGISPEVQAAKIKRGLLEKTYGPAVATAIDTYAKNRLAPGGSLIAFQALAKSGKIPTQEDVNDLISIVETEKPLKGIPRRVQNIQEQASSQGAEGVAGQMAGAAASGIFPAVAPGATKLAPLIARLGVQGVAALLAAGGAGVLEEGYDTTPVEAQERLAQGRQDYPLESILAQQATSPMSGKFSYAPALSMIPAAGVGALTETGQQVASNVMAPPGQGPGYDPLAIAIGAATNALFDDPYAIVNTRGLDMTPTRRYPAPPKGSLGIPQAKPGARMVQSVPPVEPTPRPMPVNPLPYLAGEPSIGSLRPSANTARASQVQLPRKPSGGEMVIQRSGSDLLTAARLSEPTVIPGQRRGFLPTSRSPIPYGPPELYGPPEPPAQAPVKAATRPARAGRTAPATKIPVQEPVAPQEAVVPVAVEPAPTTTPIAEPTARKTAGRKMSPKPLTPEQNEALGRLTSSPEKTAVDNAILSASSNKPYTFSVDGLDADSRAFLEQAQKNSQVVVGTDGKRVTVTPGRNHESLLNDYIIHVSPEVKRGKGRPSTKSAPVETPAPAPVKPAARIPVKPSEPLLDAMPNPAEMSESDLKMEYDRLKPFAQRDASIVRQMQSIDYQAYQRDKKRFAEIKKYYDPAKKPSTPAPAEPAAPEKSDPAATIAARIEKDGFARFPREPREDTPIRPYLDAEVKAGRLEREVKGDNSVIYRKKKEPVAVPPKSERSPLLDEGIPYPDPALPKNSGRRSAQASARDAEMAKLSPLLSRGNPDNQRTAEALSAMTEVLKKRKVTLDENGYTLYHSGKKVGESVDNIYDAARIFSEELGLPVHESLKKTAAPAKSNKPLSPRAMAINIEGNDPRIGAIRKGLEKRLLDHSNKEQQAETAVSLRTFAAIKAKGWDVRVDKDPKTAESGFTLYDPKGKKVGSSHKTLVDAAIEFGQAAGLSESDYTGRAEGRSNIKFPDAVPGPVGNRVAGSSKHTREGLLSSIKLLKLSKAIPDKDAQLARDFINELPEEYFEGLRSVVYEKTPTSVRGTAGYYENATRIIAFMADTMASVKDSGKVVPLHEVAHSLERFIFREDANALYRQFKREKRAWELSGRPKQFANTFSDFSEWFAEAIRTDWLRGRGIPDPMDLYFMPRGSRFSDKIKRILHKSHMLVFALAKRLSNLGQEDSAKMVWEKFVGAKYDKNADYRSLQWREVNVDEGILPMRLPKEPAKPGVTFGGEEAPKKRQFDLRDYFGSPQSVFLPNHDPAATGADRFGETVTAGTWERFSKERGQQASREVVNAQYELNKNFNEWERRIDDITTLLREARGANTLAGKLREKGQGIDKRRGLITQTAEEKQWEEFVDLIEKDFTDPTRTSSNPTLQKALDLHDSLTKDWLQYLRDSQLAMGKELPPDWGVTDRGYFRHLFLGNIKMRVYDPASKEWKFHKDFKSYNDALVEAQSLLKADPSLSIDLGGSLNATGDSVSRVSTAKFWQTVNEMAKSASAAASTAGGATIKLTKEDMLEDLKGLSTNSSKRKGLTLLLKRTGVDGYSKAYGDTMTATAYQLARAQELSKLNKKLTPLIEAEGREGDPSLAKEMQYYLDNLWGIPADWETAVGRVLIAAGNPFSKNLDGAEPVMVVRNMARKIVEVQTALKLSLNLKSAAVNLYQPMTTLWPYAKTSDVVAAYKLAFSKDFRKKMIENGVLSSSSKIESGDIVNDASEEWWEVFKKASNMNRAVGYAYGWQQAKARKMEDWQADVMGKTWAQLVEFDNSAWNVARVLRSPGARVTGQFKGFEFKNAERVFGKGGALHFRPDGRTHAQKMKSAAKFLGALAFGAGVNSLGPISLVTGSLLYYAAYTAAEEAGMEQEEAETYASLIQAGVPSAPKYGVDVSASLQILQEPYGNDMNEKIVNYLGGPTISSVVRGSQAAGEFAFGGKLPTVATVGGLSPYARQADALWQMIQAAGEMSLSEFLDPDEIINRVKIGNEQQIGLNAIESGQRLAGFTPSKVSRSYAMRDARARLKKEGERDQRFEAMGESIGEATQSVREIIGGKK
jgi:hypothetical protein